MKSLLRPFLPPSQTLERRVSLAQELAQAYLRVAAEAGRRS